MGSWTLRLHVAVVAFAVGTAASLVYDSMLRPHVLWARTRPSAMARQPVALPPDAVAVETQGAQPGGCAARFPGEDLDTGPGRPYVKPQPAYPPEAVRERVSGTVEVKVVVNESGRVVEARAVSGPALLYEEAVRAACRSKFSPTLDEAGHATATEGVITYKFVLHGKGARGSRPH